MKSKVPNHKPCSLCGTARGLVIYSNALNTLGTMFAPGVAICPRCDFAHGSAGGPPLPEGNVRDQ